MSLQRIQRSGRQTGKRKKLECQGRIVKYCSCDIYAEMEKFSCKRLVFL